MVHRVADFALELGSVRVLRMLRRRRGATLVWCIADAVEEHEGGVRPMGDHIELSGKALSVAAEVDVTEELGWPICEGRRITLLGLVSALSHPRVFEEVQKRLMAPGANVRTWTIDDFKRAQGVNSTADLVRKWAAGSLTRETFKSAVLEGMTIAALPLEATFFQVAWGMRAAAAVILRPMPYPLARKAALAILTWYGILEGPYRLGQMASLYKTLVQGGGFDFSKHLDAIHGALPAVLFSSGGEVADVASTALDIWDIVSNI